MEGDESTLDRPKVLSVFGDLSKVANLGYIGAKYENGMKKFGFDNPSAEIIFKFKPKSMIKESRILFGDIDPSGKNIYVVSTDDPNVRMAPREVLDLIPTDPNIFILGAAENK